MNLAELVDVVSYKSGQSKAVSREVIQTTLNIILKEVAHGGRVSIVGFGAFYQTLREARTGRNPQTGEAVAISSAKVPRFRAGKDFRDQVRKK
jgi:DNA-binding protein HU-beta